MVCGSKTNIFAREPCIDNLAACRLVLAVRVCMGILFSKHMRFYTFNTAVNSYMAIFWTDN